MNMSCLLFTSVAINKFVHNYILEVEAYVCPFSCLVMIDYCYQIFHKIIIHDKRYRGLILPLGYIFSLSFVVVRKRNYPSPSPTSHFFFVARW